MKKIFQDFPWYAILSGMYPTLALLAHNMGEVGYRVAYRAVLVSVFVAIVSAFLLYFVFRDWSRAGILTVLGLCAFFFYGHIFKYVRGLEMGGIVIGRHTYFMVVWAVLFGGLAWVAVRGTRQSIWTAVLSIMSIVLIVFPLYQLLSYQSNTWKRNRVMPPEISLPSQEAKALPDIYFIILDMYGRHDLLGKKFAYDDGPFLGKLEDLGFYVASCSKSNYPSTVSSLSATLNVNYLPALSDQFAPGHTDINLMWHLIKNNAVKNALRQAGYKIVAFETGYEWTEWNDADYFFALQSDKINNFEDLLLRNSFAAVFSEKDYFNDLLLTSDQRKHDLSLYVLDTLEEVPLLPGPKFVFVHLTIPHPPFVVGPQGELNIVPPRYKGNESYYEEEEYKVGYRNQLAFLNLRLPQVLEAILEKSAQPPIILVQGDHGPRFVELGEHLDILNAYYFPGPQPELHSSITPVNNFRMIFNMYFGMSLPMLPDKSYFPRPDRPYEFIDIPNTCGENN
ncbi:MAG: hypothetical protein JW730_04910 [Anaerolineales bacterium]|nr:hypothetical protein [Anaerolineales bacterium]